VAVSFEYGDEPSGSGATELFIYLYIYIYINKSKGNLIFNDNLCELSNPVFEVCKT
jgi:hypothetical protein